MLQNKQTNKPPPPNRVTVIDSLSCLSQNVKGRQNICTLLSVFCPNLKSLPFKFTAALHFYCSYLINTTQNKTLNSAVRAETGIEIFQKGQLKYSRVAPSLPACWISSCPQPRSLEGSRAKCFPAAPTR